MGDTSTAPAVKAPPEDGDLGITELVEFSPTRLDGVKAGATGFPFLIMKAAAEVAEPAEVPAGRPAWHAAAAALARMGAKVGNVPPGILFKAIAADGSIDEKPDIDGGKQALQLIGQLIVSEAQELAAGQFEETHDIALLLEAMSALKCWLSMERSNLMASSDEAAMCGGCGCCPACYGSVMCSAAEKALLSAKEKNDLPDSAFAYIEPGGKKDADGKTTPRSKRHYPVHDKAHADNAMARIEGGGKFGDEARRKVKAAQKKFAGDGASKSEGDDGAAVVAEEATAVDTEAIDQAVAKALASSEERFTALETELAKANATIGEMAARPVHGGPVLSAAAHHRAPNAGTDDWAAKAAYYRQQAEEHSDRQSADGYRQLAREADEKAKAVTPG